MSLLRTFIALVLCGTPWPSESLHKILRRESDVLFTTTALAPAAAASPISETLDPHGSQEIRRLIANHPIFEHMNWGGEGYFAYSGYAMSGEPLRTAKLALAFEDGFSRDRGEFVNPEIFSPLSFDARLYPIVPNEFFSFQEYVDWRLYDENIGFFVKDETKLGFAGDFSTYPIWLSPYFGKAVAITAFRRWQNLVSSGLIKPDEPFFFIEFGGGDGILARDFLEHVHTMALREGEEAQSWSTFSNVLRYRGVERSKKMRTEQLNKNSKFPQFSVSPDIQSLSNFKGLVFSNELFDNVASEKVLFLKEGKTYACFIVPELDVRGLRLDIALLDFLRSESKRLESRLALLGNPDRVFLSRNSLLAMKNGKAISQSILDQLTFHETYIPTTYLPSLDEVLHRDKDLYGPNMEEMEGSVIFYVSPQSDKWLSEIVSRLQIGDFLTIDYGHTVQMLFRWIKEGRSLLRIYNANQREESSSVSPYSSKPADITVDVNFEHLMRKLEGLGLEKIFFGTQYDLLTHFGLDFTPEALPSLASETESRSRDLALREFVEGSRFNALFYTKNKQTDPAILHSN